MTGQGKGDLLIQVTA